MNKIIGIIIVILLFVGICFGLYLGLRFLVLKESEIKNEAMFQCAQSSRYEVVSGESRVWYPAKELYEDCLDEKGL